MLKGGIREASYSVLEWGLGDRWRGGAGRRRCRRGDCLGVDAAEKDDDVGGSCS